MRVIRDGFAHINKDGARIHTKVRVLQDDGDRIAVFLSPTSGPAHVYSLHDVTLTKTSASCSHPVCFGKANRQQLKRLWEASEVPVDAS
jgi:hypothetical protein